MKHLQNIFSFHFCLGFAIWNKQTEIFKGMSWAVAEQQQERVFCASPAVSPATLAGLCWLVGFALVNSLSELQQTVPSSVSSRGRFICSSPLRLAPRLPCRLSPWASCSPSVTLLFHAPTWMAPMCQPLCCPSAPGATGSSPSFMGFQVKQKTNKSKLLPVRVGRVK